MIRTSLQPNPPIWEGTVNELTVTYDVTSYTPAQIVGSDFDLSQILLMVIDDVPLSTPVSTRRFSSLGTHSVRIIFNDSFDNCSYLFDGCSSIVNVDFENFDTSNILYMCAMFRNCEKISELNLSNFDTSKVKSMSYMFDGCANISSADISQFDTSNTHSMTHMFHGCSSLTKVYLYGDISNLNDCSDMFADIDTVGKFYYVDNANYDLVVKQLPPSWKLCDNVIVATYTVAKDTTSATKLIGNSYLLDKISTMSINDVLLDAPVDSYTFENLSEDDDTTDFIVKMQLGCQFKGLSSMFSGCTSLTNVDLSRLDASQVTSMDSIFSSCSGLTSVDLSMLDLDNLYSFTFGFGGTAVESVSFPPMPNLKTTLRMFISSKIKTFDFKAFDFSSVIQADYMFNSCKIESADMSDVYMPCVTSIKDFFCGCNSLKSLNLSNFHIPNEIDMSEFCTNCSALEDVTLTNLNVPKCTSLEKFFYSCVSLTSIDMSNLSFPNCTTIDNIFFACTKLKDINMSGIQFEKLKSFHLGGIGNVETLDLSNATVNGFSGLGCSIVRNYNGDETTLKKVSLNGFSSDCTHFNYAFNYQKSLESADVRNMNLPNATYISSMFSYCESLKELDFSGSYFPKAFEAASLFSYCTSLTKVSNLSVPCVNQMDGWFYNCTSLQTFDSTIQIGALQWLNHAFTNCTSLKSVDFSGCNLGNVYSDIYSLFYGCKALTYINMPNLKFTKETSSLNIFSGLSSLETLNISGWDTSNVTSMKNAFNSCSSLTALDLSEWDTSKVTTMSYMFSSCSGLLSVKFGNEANSSVDASGMFQSITTTGTLYYPSEYADSYANIIAAIPDTWTAEAY